jgi:hypothetical protein
VGSVTEGGNLATEVQRGRSPRKPLLALTGIGLIVGIAVAIVALVAFLPYYLLAKAPLRSFC